jgi:AcrR family transcriptional regulator
MIRRDLVLDTARTVFLQQGFRNTTVGDIAREAGYSVGALYTMFKNKDDLYIKALVRLFDEMLEELDQLVPRTAPPDQSLRRLVDVRVAHYARHRAFMRLFFDVPGGRHAKVMHAQMKLARDFFRSVVERIAEIIRAGVRQGLYADGDPVYMALGVEGLLGSACRYWITGGVEPTTDDADRIWETLERMLLRAPRKRKELDS